MTTEEIYYLAEKADLLYRLGCLLNDSAMTNKDYGTGEGISMAEAHVLKDIEEHPGITITELSKEWKKTKGAISQTVTKLEAKGFVEKRKSEKNNKNLLIFPTEKGKEFCVIHLHADAGDMLGMIEKVRKIHSVKEIEIYFDVMKTWKESI